MFKPTVEHDKTRTTDEGHATLVTDLWCSTLQLPGHVGLFVYLTQFKDS